MKRQEKSARYTFNLELKMTEGMEQADRRKKAAAIGTS
jgi:hypothetical protein